jgi:hypothetical protein
MSKQIPARFNNQEPEQSVVSRPSRADMVHHSIAELENLNERLTATVTEQAIEIALKTGRIGDLERELASVKTESNRRIAEIKAEAAVREEKINCELRDARARGTEYEAGYFAVCVHLDGLARKARRNSHEINEMAAQAINATRAAMGSDVPHQVKAAIGEVEEEPATEAREAA